MAGAKPRAAPIEVAAAMIQDPAGRYLIGRRPEGAHLGGLWEFPGGKRKPGETLETCLQRELAEELGAQFSVNERVETVTWEYPEKIVTLHFYRCRLQAGTIEPREGQALAWVEPGRLSEYAFPPADRALIASLSAPARDR